MYYTMREGVHRSWRDRAHDALQHIRGRGWLPMAVATIVTAWLALIISGLNQSVPPIQTPPAQFGNTNDSLTVGYKTDTPDNLTVTSATSSSTRMSGPSTSAASSTAPTSTGSSTTPVSKDVVSSTVSSVTDTIGGRGGDDGSAAQPAPATTPSSDTSSSDSSMLGADVGAGSLLDTSVDVGGDSLLQVDLDVGGTDIL